MLVNGWPSLGLFLHLCIDWKKVLSQVCSFVYFTNFIHRLIILYIFEKQEGDRVGGHSLTTNIHYRGHITQGSKHAYVMLITNTWHIRHWLGDIIIIRLRFYFWLKHTVCCTCIFCDQEMDGHFLWTTLMILAIIWESNKHIQFVQLRKMKLRRDKQLNNVSSGIHGRGCLEHRIPHVQDAPHTHHTSNILLHSNFNLMEDLNVCYNWDSLDNVELCCVWNK